MTKITCVENHCIIKIKSMNKIQHLEIQKKYIALLFISIMLFLLNT